MSQPVITLTAWLFIVSGGSRNTSNAPTVERRTAQLACGQSNTNSPRRANYVVSTCTRCGVIETVTLCASHTPAGTSLIPGCAITAALNTARSAAAATTSSTARSVTPWFTRAIDHVENHLRMHTRLRRPMCFPVTGLQKPCSETIIPDQENFLRFSLPPGSRFS